MCQARQRNSILVVNVNAALHTLLQLFLEARGFQVEIAQNYTEAHQKLSQVPFDVVLVDVKGVNFTDGLFATGFDKNKPPVPVIAIATPEENAHLHYQRVLTKPLRMNELTSMIHSTLM